MEDVLSIYLQPYNPRRPVVCLDESSKQQIQELIEELSPKPGMVSKFDSEYKRNGVSNLFMFFEPLAGHRHIKVTDRRTAIDFAHCLKDLVDVHYPDVEKIIVVMDNLNTHNTASLYKAFAPEEAFRIAQKLEIHFTPKHGSWLNMAEIEFSALSRQCLKRRIPDQDTLCREIQAWEEARNSAKVKCRWQFSTEKARIKLHKLYPTIESHN